MKVSTKQKIVMTKRQKHVVFRADASPTLGGGHIFRCLAFANGLRDAGWMCTFAVSPETPTTVPALTASGHAIIVPDTPNDSASVAIALNQKADLLVVDHYGLDQSFETPARHWADRILVIDDLADRPHNCDALLDQTLGRKSDDYQELVPEACRLFLGPHYAMLRPEFSELRASSLVRRNGELNRILIAIGGSDPKDITSLALHAIQDANIHCPVDVVLGSISPNLAQVRSLIENMKAQATLHLDTPHMANLMAQADLAIGACGVTSWERCTLGLPTLAVVIADNQRLIAQNLVEMGAILYAGDWTSLTANTLAQHLQQIQMGTQHLKSLSLVCRSVCDGQGIPNLVKTVSAL